MVFTEVFTGIYCKYVYIKCPSKLFINDNVVVVRVETIAMYRAVLNKHGS